MDIWIAVGPKNAARIIAALRDFGFSASLSGEFFEQPGQIIRMGVPPFRIEMLTGVSGLTFDQAYARRQVVEIDGVGVSLISLDDLRTNKKASGRLKDLADLEHLG